jgi:hypothetical protein
MHHKFQGRSRGTAPAGIGAALPLSSESFDYGRVRRSAASCALEGGARPASIAPTHDEAALMILRYYCTRS